MKGIIIGAAAVVTLVVAGIAIARSVGTNTDKNVTEAFKDWYSASRTKKIEKRFEENRAKLDTFHVKSFETELARAKDSTLPLAQRLDAIQCCEEILNYYTEARSA